MKKLILMLVIAVMSVSMLATATSAFTVDTFTLGKGAYAVVVKGEIGNGGLVCDKLPEFVPEINCPEQDTDKPTEDEDIVPPEQDADKPSDDEVIVPPIQDDDKPSDDEVITPPAQDTDKPSDDEVVVPPVQDNDTPQGGTDTTPPAEDDDAPVADSSLNEYEKEVIRLVNEIRASYGLGELEADEELSRVARIKSQDMKDNNYFSHTSPIYGSPFEMMKKFGISYRTAGENIAKGQKTPQAVVNGWMNSSGHRANILNASYTAIGVGYVADGNYWTQMFVGR